MLFLLRVFPSSLCSACKSPHFSCARSYSWLRAQLKHYYHLLLLTCLPKVTPDNALFSAFWDNLAHDALHCLSVLQSPVIMVLTWSSYVRIITMLIKRAGSGALPREPTVSAHIPGTLLCIHICNQRPR